jgi:hypothetical protein
VVIYAPSVNAIFWLQNYDRTSAHGNVHRINVDQGANGTWDCFYDFSPQALPGASPGDWFDWQDLVLGSNSLYHTANVFNQVGDLTRTVIQRLPLSQMAACVPRSMINVFNVFSSASSALSFFRATHGAGTTIYWGAHVSTSTLRIFGLAEGCSSVSCISINDRSVDPWIESNRVSQPSTCPGPDNLDWCGRSTGNILGAYVANGVIGFLWNATQGGGFPYPHVRFARFRESDRSLLSQGQIWNPRFAFLYPSVAVNSRGHLGGTILTGGGDFFPSCNAWIADDINGGGLEPLDLHNVVSGTSGPVENVSGDYLTARPHAVFPNTWIGTCFSLQGGGRNTNARPRFVWFGRQRDTP